MKKISLSIAMLIFVIPALLHSPTLIAQEWSSWQKVGCYPKLEFRVKWLSSYDGTDKWKVDFKNNYSERVYFDTHIVNPAETDTGISYAQTVGAGEIRGSHDYVTNARNSVKVWVDSSDFYLGKDNKEEYRLSCGESVSSGGGSSSNSDDSDDQEGYQVGGVVLKARPYEAKPRVEKPVIRFSNVNNTRNINVGSFTKYNYPIIAGGKFLQFDGTYSPAGQTIRMAPENPGLGTTIQFGQRDSHGPSSYKWFTSEGVYSEWYRGTEISSRRNEENANCEYFSFSFSDSKQRLESATEKDSFSVKLLKNKFPSTGRYTCTLTIKEYHDGPPYNPNEIYFTVTINFGEGGQYSSWWSTDISGSAAPGSAYSNASDEEEEEVYVPKPSDPLERITESQVQAFSLRDSVGFNFRLPTKVGTDYSYEIYYCTAKHIRYCTTLLGTTQYELTYEDDALWAAEYYYAVKVCDSSTCGRLSRVFEAYISPGTPEPPTNLTGYYDEYTGEFFLSWEKMRGISSFVFYRCEDASESSCESIESLSSRTIPKTEWVDDVSSLNGTFYYRIKARAPIFASKYSEPFEVEFNSARADEARLISLSLEHDFPKTNSFSGKSYPYQFWVGLSNDNGFTVTDEFTNKERITTVISVETTTENIGKAGWVYAIFVANYKSEEASANAFGQTRGLIYIDDTGSLIKWDGDFGNLFPMYYIDSLYEINPIIIFDEYLFAGKYKLYLGFLEDNGNGDLIYTGKAHPFVVKRAE